MKAIITSFGAAPLIESGFESFASSLFLDRCCFSTKRSENAAAADDEEEKKTFSYNNGWTTTERNFSFSAAKKRVVRLNVEW